MIITYTETKVLNRQSLLGLYNDVGWMAYTKEPYKLVDAIQNSLYVLTAWEGDILVGLIRVVGDGLTIVYIQDLLVLQAYQRQGIGREMINKVLERFKDVRQKVLLTDDTEKTRAFYGSMGFQPCDDGRLVAFAKLK